MGKPERFRPGRARTGAAVVFRYDRSMEPAPPSRNQEIVDELRREMARMAELLTYDIEPAVTFTLKAPDDRP